MDKHSQQMKTSVKAELGRDQEMKISHVSRTRMCHEPTTKPAFMRPSRAT